MKTLVTICARGGSKGIPGKNIKELQGRPLIFYTIKVAKQFQSEFPDVEVILSSDSDEILSISGALGLKSSYRRPESLAGDIVGKVEVIDDVLKWKEATDRVRFDYVLDLDVTSPLRNLTDLVDAFAMLRKNDQALNLFSVSPASRNPYFNMVEQKENGFYAQVKEPGALVFTRQATPKVYDMNASFYFYRRSFFDLGTKGAITARSLVYVVPHICFDLDHPIDFEFISFLMANNKLGFAL